MTLKHKAIAVVIGYGSIGKRHVQLLEEEDWQVVVISKHHKGKACFPNLESFFESRLTATLAIIASETHLHQHQLETLISHLPKINILVEKPLGFKAPRPAHQHKIWVGYNLRCHPLIQRLKQELQNERLISLSIDIRRHLPTMRGPEQDYRKSYSCFTKKGGGVLRDFSHDLDLVQHLSGPWLRAQAHGGKYGQLHGDAMDTCSINGKSERCPHVQVHMSYLDPMPCRKIRLITSSRSIELDLDHGRWSDSSGQHLNQPRALNDSYRKQIQDLKHHQPWLCGFDEALRIEQLIEDLETSILTPFATAP
jgi:predicted dehydrogenase